MKIYLDFDGTVVEHAYPEIGRFNYGCEKTIMALVKAGHKIILNTMRVEFPGPESPEFQAAFQFMSENDHFEISDLTHTPKKLSPTPFLVTYSKEDDVLFIDDQQRLIPLKPGVEFPNGNMVDWEAVHEELILRGIIA